MMMNRVGFLGMGVMGSRMSQRLLDAGYDVTVWNRSPEKCAPLAVRGATVAATPAEAVAGCDIVLAILTDAPALRSVISGPGGVLQSDPLPPLFVDMATISPAQSTEFAELLESRGIKFLRAPVSGTAVVVETGQLTVIASGDVADFEAADPYLATFSCTRYFVGPGENARYLKLIHQMMIGANMQVWGEGLVMGEKAGLDWDTMLEVLGNSAVGSGVVKSKIPSLAARDYDHPGNSLHNIAKDLDLALAAGKQAGVELPATQRIRELYDRGLEAGFEWKDYSALILAMEQRAGLEPKESVS
jgi:3-hydroxyisobutyrate dehydrogenase-like beta-hydroxyacid dehydrogenase